MAQVTEEGTQVNWPKEEDYLQVVAGGYLNIEEPRVLVFPNILVEISQACSGASGKCS